MLTLMLVIGLCSDVGCDYMDVTSRFPVETDADCFVMADYLNSVNREKGEESRLACIEPQKYALLAKKEI